MDECPGFNIERQHSRSGPSPATECIAVSVDNCKGVGWLQHLTKPLDRTLPSLSMPPKMIIRCSTISQQPWPVLPPCSMDCSSLHSGIYCLSAVLVVIAVFIVVEKFCVMRVLVSEIGKWKGMKWKVEGWRLKWKVEAEYYNSLAVHCTKSITNLVT